MDMSPACQPPRQPLITETDRQHPHFRDYMRYRTGMNHLMVECCSFADWLRMEEREASDAQWEAHPRYPEFKQWMWANAGGARPCKPTADLPRGLCFPQNFAAWLGGVRW